MLTVKFVLLLVSLPIVLSDWPCLYAPPCSCNYVASSVDCSHKGLTAVPSILNYLLGKQWNMDFSYNKITSVPDGIFGNISINTLNLDHNEISSVGENVFNKTEDIVFSLSLHFNKLKQVPPAIGKLTNLYELYIHGNPINEYDQDVLRNISQTLNRVSYGSTTLQRWPSEINILSKATWTTVYGIDLETLPHDAFSDDLFILNITGSSLRSLSDTLSNKNKFYELDLKDNIHLTAEGLAKGSFKALPKLRTLSIINCSLDTLPPIFNDLTDLGEIILIGNPITSIDDSVFPKNYTSIYQMTIKDSLLTQVPATFSNLKKLMNIYIINGKISSISENDFAGMTEMYNLYLSGNPISNISVNAFKNLKELGFMYLDNTLMTTIPKAIQNMPYLNTLNMNNSRVECSCDNLGWMKEWLPSKKRSLQVIGKCFNSDKAIQSFLNVDLLKC